MSYSSDFRNVFLTSLAMAVVKQKPHDGSVSLGSTSNRLRGTQVDPRSHSAGAEVPDRDYQALKQRVADFPDAKQNERAAHFGVSRQW